MFALWYLISKPRGQARVTSPEFSFGYKKSYSGVGVFLLQQLDVGHLAQGLARRDEGASVTPALMASKAGE